MIAVVLSIVLAVCETSDESILAEEIALGREQLAALGRRDKELSSIVGAEKIDLKLRGIMPELLPHAVHSAVQAVPQAELEEMMRHLAEKHPEPLVRAKLRQSLLTQEEVFAAFKQDAHTLAEALAEYEQSGGVGPLDGRI